MNVAYKRIQSHSIIPSGQFTLNIEGKTSPPISPAASINDVRNAIIATNPIYNVRLICFTLYELQILDLLMCFFSDLG